MLQTDPAYQGMTKEEFVKAFALRVFKIAGFDIAEFSLLYTQHTQTSNTKYKSNHLFAY
jgi:hypothetical protein